MSDLTETGARLPHPDGGNVFVDPTLLTELATGTIRTGLVVVGRLRFVAPRAEDALVHAGWAEPTCGGLLATGRYSADLMAESPR
ncbi:hypothetical protein [Nocardioides pakistanensis]